MPVELTIVESVTELETTVIEVVLESSSAPGPAGPGVAVGGTVGQVLTKQSSTDFDTDWQDPTSGGADDQTAAEVPFTPAGNLSSTDVQDALEELDSEVTSAISGLSAVYQPLDSDLTAVAALTTTAFGRGLLELANQAALLSAAGAAAASHTHAGEDITSGTVADARIASTIARDSEVTSAISALSTVYQPLDSDLTAIAALTTTSFGRAFLAFADEAAFKAGVNLEAGTDFPSLTTFNDHSSRHENGGADEISIAGLDGTPTELTNHLSDSSDAHDASAISVLDTGTFYTATDVEGVLAEIAPQLGGGGGDFELICDSVLGSNQNTFDTNTLLGGNISGSYKHLKVIVNGRSSRAGSTLDFFHMRFNNDSGNNYDTLYTQETTGGSSYAQSGIGADTTNAAMALFPAASSGAGVAGSCDISLHDYAGTTFHKVVIVKGMGPLDTGDIRFWDVVGKWRSTSAITRITLTMVNGNFLTGSRFTVYGLK